MSAFLASILLPIAIILEIRWRGRWIDEHGNLRPSRRELAMIERLQRAIDRHERERTRRHRPF